MSEVKAITKNIKISPEKVNLLVAQIKKMSPLDAVNVLTLVNKSSAPVLKKLINSALANAKNNNGLVETDLIFKEIIVTKGPMFKRYQPISRGRAHHILKRTSHITVILTQKAADNKQPEKQLKAKTEKATEPVKATQSKEKPKGESRGTKS